MSHSLYQHEMSKGTREREQGAGQNTMDATQTFLSTADGTTNSGVSAGYAALDSIAGGIGAPLQFSAAIEVAQRQFGNRATLKFVHRQQVHQVAQAGLRDAGQPYPFLDEIQRSFGQHDISGLEGHTGEAARVANSELGSTAYHKGGHVAFGQAPTLADAAHEAAHYVQGVGATQLKGGVGQAGDVYERHADRVAAAVVAGESAEPLLDLTPGGSGSPAAATSDAPVQMTGGLLSHLGGMGRRGFASRGRWGLGLGAGLGLAALAGGLYARTGRQQEEPPKQTGPMLSEGGGRGNVKLSGPQFFDSTVDFASYVSMLQHRVLTMRNRDPNFYNPFKHINDHKYGMMEAIISRTDPEIIEDNLRRIEEQYSGVTPQPGTADFYRHVCINNKGQIVDLAHTSVEVIMGDIRFHIQLRGDTRQIAVTDENGKAKREFIHPSVKPKDFGLQESFVVIDDKAGYGFTICERYDKGLPDKYLEYKGSKVRGYARGNSIFQPMIRFEGIELPEAFSALMLAELSEAASIGVYTMEDTVCVLWCFDALEAGGADMEKIAPDVASGNRYFLNKKLTIDLDKYLAHHTTHHPNKERLNSIRDPNATVVDRKGETHTLIDLESTPFKPFRTYSDGTQPWKLPQDAPWPWEKGYQRYINESGPWPWERK